MDQARSFVPPILLALLTLACAIVGPPHGSPKPIVMGAILLSSLLSSTAGFAFSAICGGILFHLWDDQVRIVQIMIVCSIANQSAMVWSLRHEIQWSQLLRLLAGAAFGLPFGVWVLFHADHRLYTEALGLLLLAYGLTMLLGIRHRKVVPHTGIEVAVGFVAGITGGAAALPGAPVTIWCRAQGLDGAAQRGLYQPFILVLQIATLATMALFKHNGPASGLELPILLCVPAGLLGTSIGMAFFRRMSNRQFALAVNTLLIVSGLSFVL
ncbi:MAG: sulfite exporter TauE/SafE family protein [Acetobacteraceae bacterium]|nr:sulfite exporter TauE/SafE family protein [Acetobacteraceae bacterium]